MKPESRVDTAPPRAVGNARLRAVRRGAQTVIGDLYQQGASKVLFPRAAGSAMTAVQLNTAGGITGGDRFTMEARAETGAQVVMTTQAAERAYAANDPAPGRIQTRLHVGAGARIDWLPQEMILFERAAIDRHLDVTMTGDSSVLLVEPVIFGRAAMGERLTALGFADRIDIHRGGALLYSDRTRIAGDARRILAGAGTGGGAGAMANVLYAEARLAPARALLPDGCGVSLIRPGLLAARLLAAGGFDLRAALIPLIGLLCPHPLPRTWTI